MVSIKNIITLGFVGLFAVGCASSKGPDRYEQKEDIYKSFNEDNIEYRTEEKPLSKRDPGYVASRVVEIRNLYHRGESIAAEDLADRMIRLDPSVAEVYYWLTRLAIDRADFQKAYNMAQKGISVSTNDRMTEELESLREIAQMGAN